MSVAVRLRGPVRVGVLLGVSVVLLAVWLRQQWGGAFVTEAVNDVAEFVFAVFATGCAVLAALAGGPG